MGKPKPSFRIPFLSISFVKYSAGVDLLLAKECFPTSECQMTGMILLFQKLFFKVKFIIGLEIDKLFILPRFFFRRAIIFRTWLGIEVKGKEGGKASRILFSPPSSMGERRSMAAPSASSGPPPPPPHLFLAASEPGAMLKFLAKRKRKYQPRASSSSIQEIRNFCVSSAYSVVVKRKKAGTGKKFWLDWKGERTQCSERCQDAKKAGRGIGKI